MYLKKKIFFFKINTLVLIANQSIKLLLNPSNQRIERNITQSPFQKLCLKENLICKVKVNTFSFFKHIFSAGNIKCNNIFLTVR